MPLATCHTRCFHNGRAKRYWPGDTDEFDKKDEFAKKYFTFGAVSPKNPEEEKTALELRVEELIEQRNSVDARLEAEKEARIKAEEKADKLDDKVKVLQSESENNAKNYQDAIKRIDDLSAAVKDADKKLKDGLAEADKKLKDSLAAAGANLNGKK